MQPSLSGEISRQRSEEVRRAAEVASRVDPLATPVRTDPVPVAIRFASSGDREALDRLAALDSARPPAGETLVAEVGGRIRAALPLGAGRALADPFAPSAHAAALLELRARQLGAAAAPRTWRRLAHALAAPAAPRRHA